MVERQLMSATWGTGMAALVLLTSAAWACTGPGADHGKANDASGAAADPAPVVLLLTKTAGFRHTSIEPGIEAVQNIATQAGWQLTPTEDASLFNDATLRSYHAVMLLNTTGDILDVSQQQALQKFCEEGGGLIGVHAATDTEPDWPWYGAWLGARFASHPAIQQALIELEDTTHEATRDLPSPWGRADEWYNFSENPRARPSPSSSPT